MCRLHQTAPPTVSRYGGAQSAERYFSGRQGLPESPESIVD
ncbi:hypothetical protein F528_1281 [Neisseria meningitidis 992008]|nr:hypothetical protein F528_1281 [Neisseria meningitidis 992008]